MARKKKSALAGLVNNAREIASYKKNPVVAPLMEMAVVYIAPAVAGYAVTRVAGRMVKSFVEPRFPKLATLSAVLANAATFGTLWYASSKVKSLSNYQAGLLAGSGVALAQTVINALLPGLGRIIFDQPPVFVAPTSAGDTDFDEPMDDEAPTSSGDDAIDENGEEIAAVEGEEEQFDEFRQGVFN